MKRIISIIIGLISVLGLQAQVTECMRIYTDKDNYLAGEDLWIKVCVTDSAEAPFSKVAYVEISDMRQVYAQGKIAEEGTHSELIARNGIYNSMWNEYQRTVTWTV